MGLQYSVPIYMEKHGHVFNPFSLAQCSLCKHSIGIFIAKSYFPCSIIRHVLPTYLSRGLNLEVIAWAIKDEITFLLTQQPELK